MAWTTIIIFSVLGAVLIAVDFYLPTFVLAGIGATLLLAATLIGYGATGSIDKTILLFCGEAALGFGAAYASIKYFPRTSTGRKMILGETQTGVRAQASQQRDWIGHQGVAHTILRPSGVALIDGRRLDVVAESGVIESGTPVKIVAVNENQLVVRKLS
ncbi:MAG TPA: NfeD family protein [Verrucomicrobiae bacterium]|nr:NfeD family protein [Verrucomicrobiae bacterium]